MTSLHPLKGERLFAPYRCKRVIRSREFTEKERTRPERYLIQLLFGWLVRRKSPVDCGGDNRMCSLDKLLLISGGGIIVATAWSTGWRVSRKVLSLLSAGRLPYRTEVIYFSAGVDRLDTILAQLVAFQSVSREKESASVRVSRGTRQFSRRYDKAAIIFPRRELPNRFVSRNCKPRTRDFRLTNGGRANDFLWKLSS